MADLRIGAARGAAALTLVTSAVLLGGGIRPAAADVTALNGSAYGVSAPNIFLFGGTQAPYGPKPAVTLPAAGSTPITGHDNSESVTFGAAVLFESGAVDVSTQGALGAGGSVTSSATVNNISTANGGQLSATSVAATCTAKESGVTGSTTVNGGTVATQTAQSGDVTATQAVPTTPAPNTRIDGQLVLSSTDTETFTYVFNEQTANADGSLTVNAVHLILHGPTAKGDVFVGHVVCGVTASATTTTTTAGGSTTTTAPTTTTTAPSTTTTPASSTTTAAQQLTTTIAPATTTTSAPPTVTDVSGGAYGVFASVSLFGGPANIVGPTPTVQLPAGGSATPVTASAPSGTAQFGPATLFSSGQLSVSTQGTTGPAGSVTSSATIQNENSSGQEAFTASSIGSTCSATQSGVSGSVSVSGGSLVTAEDNAGNATQTVTIAANPAANTSFDGSNQVGDRFRLVVNEQLVSAGSITVNAMHMYLLGPTAVGDLIVGQSRCALAASSGGGTNAGTTSAGGTSVARTGIDAATTTALALDLVVAGWFAVRWSERRRRVRSVTGGRRETI